MNTNTLFGARAARSRERAEQVWAVWVAQKSDLQLPSAVWDMAWDERRVAHTLALFAADEISSDTCHQLLEACVMGQPVSPARLGEAAAAMLEELRIWHTSWYLAKVTNRVFDFENNFGWHALPGNDAAWSSTEFLSDWMAIAGSGCRGEDQLTRFHVGAGPLEPSQELVKATKMLLPSEYNLISIAGSGTEAVLSFYDLANAYLTALHEKPVSSAVLLFFRGAYIGGAHGLQGANGTYEIARHALAPATVTDDHMINDAPYSQEALDELDALFHGTPNSAGTTAAERECLQQIEAQIMHLEVVGEHVGGVVVEYVMAKDARGLRPAFLAGLRELLDRRQLLLFEDAVMVGLRCGAPFLGAVCRAARPDFVAIGKAFGFSGVVANSGCAGLCKRMKDLNGYLTCRISCADLLRAITVLHNTHSRGLMTNARESGRQLKLSLQKQGLRVWGIGFLLAYDKASGLFLNARVLFARCLPALTFGEHGVDVEEVRVITGTDAKRVAERVVALKLEDPVYAGAARRDISKAAAQSCEFLKVLQAQGAASAFAWV